MGIHKGDQEIFFSKTQKKSCLFSKHHLSFPLTGDKYVIRALPQPLFLLQPSIFFSSTSHSYDIPSQQPNLFLCRLPNEL